MSPDQVPERNVERPRMALYVPHFLTISMTFVYRQLLGVSEDFDTSVLTTGTDHLDLFPFPAIHVEPSTPLDRAARAWAKHARGSSVNIGPFQRQRFAQHLGELRPALIHAHFGPAGLDLLPVARKLQIPLLVTFHGYDASSMLRRASYRRDLRALFEYAHVIAISQRMANQLIELGAVPSRTQHHYIGVPLDTFAFVERKPVQAKLEAGEALRFLQVSNFVEKKGHATTVEAFARYLEHHPSATLTLAGDGPLRASIEAQVWREGIAKSVEFVGKVGQEHVARLMAESDVFLHHSVTAADGDQEGIPTVLMEAMARGLLVVSTRHAGIEELVEDGSEGFLVEERDVEGYVDVLRGLVDADPAMCRRARAKVDRHFDIARQNRRLVDIYREVIDSKRAD